MAIHMAFGASQKLGDGFANVHIEPGEALADLPVHGSPGAGSEEEIIAHIVTRFMEHGIPEPCE